MVAALAGAVSCVIADTPPELPEHPKHPPRIVDSSAVPSPARVLTKINDTYVLPVDIPDPDTTFDLHVFVDGDYLPGSSFTVEPDPSTTQGGLRLVTFVIDGVDAARCHVVEAVVALEFEANSVRTPVNGGDSLVWYYSPTGDLGGCLVAPDGGWPVDGSFPDGTSEGG
jgi:hypothetical protein